MFACPTLRAVLGAVLLATYSAAAAQTDVAFFRHYVAQPNDLARRQFLTTQLAQLPAPEQSLARQLLAGTDCELGLYEQALANFPFDQRQPPQTPIPKPTTLPAFELLGFHNFGLIADSCGRFRCHAIAKPPQSSHLVGAGKRAIPALTL